MDWLLTFADPTIDWNYAMVTLVVRFIGVFIVMLVMQVALQISSVAVRRIEARQAAAAEVAAAPQPAAPAVVKAGEPAEPTPSLVDDATAAAIGLALALEAQASASSGTEAGPSSWAVAGRLAQLNRLPR